MAASYTDGRMNAILIGLEMLSHGRVAQPGGGGSGDSQAVMPAGELHPPHLLYAAMYRAAGSDRDRQIAVLVAAEEALKRGRKRVAPHVAEETPEQWARRVVAHAGWPAGDVALAMRCTVRAVRHARRVAGLEAEFGVETLAERPRTTTILRRQRARDLVRRGKSPSEIARLLDVDKSTVSRDLA